MTTYILTTFDGDPDEGTVRVLDADSAQDVLAEFFAHPDVSDGMGVIIRKADYMAPAVSPFSSREAAHAYINGATSTQDRRERKAQVFQVVYGGSMTGRFITHHPAFKLVRREPNG